MNQKLYDATLDVVKQLHGQQLRKYTDAPYWTHCDAVAKIVSEHDGDPIMIAAALCHDVLEDTECDMLTLSKSLQGAGWSSAESWDIAHLVEELTDEYTSERYPNLNREWRKNKEASRLAEVSPEAQTIKYADLIDNTGSITEYDPAFARTYLEEKALYLWRMTKGSPVLYKKAGEAWRQAVEKVGPVARVLPIELMR